MAETSANNAKRRFGAVLNLARQAPITITRHGRPAAVLVPCDSFRYLLECHKRCSEETLLHALENVPEDPAETNRHLRALAPLWRAFGV